MLCMCIRDEAILIHIHDILFYEDVMIIETKALVFSENFIRTETFT